MAVMYELDGQRSRGREGGGMGRARGNRGRREDTLRRDLHDWCPTLPRRNGFYWLVHRAKDRKVVNSRRNFRKCQVGPEIIALFMFRDFFSQILVFVVLTLVSCVILKSVFPIFETNHSSVSNLAPLR